MLAGQGEAVFRPGQGQGLAQDDQVHQGHPPQKEESQPPDEPQAATGDEDAEKAVQKQDGGHGEEEKKAHGDAWEIHPPGEPRPNEAGGLQKQDPDGAEEELITPQHGAQTQGEGGVPLPGPDIEADEKDQESRDA